MFFKQCEQKWVVQVDTNTPTLGQNDVHYFKFGMRNVQMNMHICLLSCVLYVCMCVHVSAFLTSVHTHPNKPPTGEAGQSSNSIGICNTVFLNMNSPPPVGRVCGGVYMCTSYTYCYTALFQPYCIKCWRVPKKLLTIRLVYILHSCIQFLPAIKQNIESRSTMNGTSQINSSKSNLMNTTRWMARQRHGMFLSTRLRLMDSNETVIAVPERLCCVCVLASKSPNCFVPQPHSDDAVEYLW